MKRRNYNGINFGYTPQEMKRLREHFIQGDTSVWDDIFVKTHADFLQDVKSKGIPIEDAEDIVQNVWIKFYEQLWKGFPNYEKVRSWFGQVLYNKCMDYFNEKSKEASRKEQGDGDGDGNTPDDTEVQEAAEIYMEVLNQMTPKCIQVIQLHVFEGLTHLEVATAIEDSYVAVRKRYERCMECLREKIAKLRKE